MAHILVVPPSIPPGARASAQSWVRAIENSGADLAAVIVEPVSGASGGAAPTSPETLLAIREATRRVGALVVSDEVMTGLGRLGVWSPSVRAGMAPDLIVVAKGLGAGYAPIGAVLVAANCPMLNAPYSADLGTFGHTMAGNPVAAAVGLAVLNEIVENDVLGRVRRRSPALREEVQSAARAGGFPADAVRGTGFLLAVSTASLPNPRRAAAKLVEIAAQHDLLLHPAGIDDTTASILIAPPLTATEADLDELLCKFSRSATALFQTYAHL